MKKITAFLKKFLAGAVLVAMLGSQSAAAVDIVTSSGVWYRSGDNMFLNPSTLEVGSTTSRIAKIWATALDATTATIGAIVGAFDLNGGELILDADGDSSLTADTDNQLDLKLGGSDRFSFTAGLISFPTSGGSITAGSHQFGRDLNDGFTFNVPTGESYSFNVQGASELILDASQLYPGADGGLALGRSSAGYNGIHLNTGTAISWEGVDVTLTHSADLLTLAGGTFAHTATLASATDGFVSNYTTSGSGGTNRSGMLINFLSGYTGSGFTSGFAVDASVAGTSTSFLSDSTIYGYRPNGNRGLNAYSRAVTTGMNVAGLYLAGGGSTNIPIWAAATVSKAGTVNVGTFTSALKGTGTTQIALYAALSNGGAVNAAPVWGDDAVIVADNYTQTSDILSLRDNNVVTWKLADGGILTHAPATFASSSGTDSAQVINATLNQTGTAGSELFQINLTATATGSGDHYFATFNKGGNPLYGFQSGISRFEIFSTNASNSDAEIYGLHESASPANDDIVFTITGAGLDNAGTPNERSYGQIQFIAEDITTTAEDGELKFLVQKAGTLTNVVSFSSTDVTFSYGTQTYEFGDRSGALTLQGLSTGSQSNLELYTNDGDETDSAAYKVFGQGIPSDTDPAHLLTMGWSSGLSEYRIVSEAVGAVTVQPLVIYTGSNTNQLRLQTDGTVDFGGAIKMDVGTGTGQLKLDGSVGGCIMLRDTDDAGWTEVDALDGVLTASIDADGVCD